MRITLDEIKIDYTLIEEDFWNRRANFLALDPRGETPLVIIEEEDVILSGNFSSFEYIFEQYREKQEVMPLDLKSRLVIGKIVEWFDLKFYREVTKYLIDERVFKQLIFSKTIKKPPNSSAIRAAKTNLKYHIEYIDFLLKDHTYLKSDKFTIADIACASQISLLDFIGEMNWDNSSKLKEWYSIVKSRKSVQCVLKDAMSGVHPPEHYMIPDF
ncbi:Glutathione S-transferase family protein [Candidatus Cyrtobacter comes]|uniref:Glutathione S-transferase family protein n=2 Tax=Candidatus Cyrtobacter comes TaxID=675776 RepID=A0ABU5L6E2_9RICK|nr:Glutathione S-transferase family protein [Candidatus Cyrtobacter comes]